jgi:hypothetical protein
VELVLPVVPVVAGGAADQGQAEHPRDAAEEGEQREPPERHLGDARRQRDEGPDDRQHPAPEDGRLAVLAEPAVGGLEVLGVDVDQPVLLEQLHATVVADAPAHPGADDVAEDAGGDGGEQRHVAVADVEAREQHRRLARDRHAGALERHQDEDPDDADRIDDVDREVHDRVGYRGD